MWKSDGFASGTVMVKDINNGSSDSSPIYLTVVGNTLYFRATDGTYGVELWKSDGTASGTVMVKDLSPGSDSSDLMQFTSIGDQIYFLFLTNIGTPDESTGQYMRTGEVWVLSL